VAASRSEWRVPLTVPHVLRPNLAALLRRRLARLRASLRPARDPLAAAQLYWHTIGALTARAG
jgi:hypothetical protein